VLKGTAWAHTVYPEPHLRQSGDIDLLVTEEDQATASQVLEDRGFGVSWNLFRDHGPSCLRTQTGCGTMCIELHPDLSQPSRYPHLRGSAPTDRAFEHYIWGRRLRLCALELGCLQAVFQLAWRLRTGGYARYLVDFLHLPAAEAFDGEWFDSLVRASGVRGLRYCGTALLGAEATPRPQRLAIAATWVFGRGLSCPWGRSSRLLRAVSALGSVALWDRWDDRFRHVYGYLRAVPRWARREWEWLSRQERRTRI